MERSKEELEAAFADFDPQAAFENFKKTLTLKYEESDWYEIDRYYDSMKPRPYSMRDMEEKTFHTDLCKQPEL